MRRSIALGCALLTYCWSPATFARDYGQQGATFPIVEVNLLKAIAARLHAMQANGQFDALQQQLRERMVSRVNRPEPVAGLTPATAPRVFNYDPSIVFDRDIKDRSGRLIVAAGSKFNPLTMLPFRQTYVFFDADRPQELRYVLERFGKRADVKLVMVRGAPLEAMKRYQQRFYFDQGGMLCAKLRITHTPTVMEPAGTVLKLTEVVL